MLTRFFHCILATLLLVSCSIVDVKLTRGTDIPARNAVKSLAPASRPAALLEQASDIRLSKEKRLELMLEAARQTSTARPETESGKINRIATAQLVEILVQDNFQTSAIQIAPASRSILDPRVPSKLIPAASIQIKGLRERVRVEGAGVPYVAWFDKGSTALSGQPGGAQSGMSLPVTAILGFDKKQPELTFHRRLQVEHIVFNGRKEVLAADFSAPLAYLLSRGRNSAIDIQALIFSDRNFHRTGLLQIDEFDPKKIPVVFVHGLLCRPSAWTPAVNQLLADPEIRARYQFWFYLYPTGLPVWVSAAKLRSELERYRSALDPSRKNPNLDDVVLVGHSMGGLISSLMVRKGGEGLWKQFTDVHPEKLKISASAKAHLMKLVDFEPRPEISRVIFVATPHQGSRLALNPAADFLSNLVRLPNIFSPVDRLVFVNAIRDNLRDIFTAPANSIRFLRAKSPLLLAILKLPMSRRVTAHSIIGDQGKGNTPQSSDGVVPYWSSHLPDAKSEKVVPSGHGANEHPQGIEEIRRILILHANNPRS